MLLKLNSKIPLNWTIFKHLEKGTQVNLEFDVIGKYVARLHNIKN